MTIRPTTLMWMDQLVIGKTEFEIERMINEAVREGFTRFRPSAARLDARVSRCVENEA
jgi:hypothetical protein